MAATVRPRSLAAHRRPVDIAVRRRSGSHVPRSAPISTFVGWAAGQVVPSVGAMAIGPMRTRVTALWERYGPRSLDLTFVLIGVAAAAAETLARRHEAPAVWSLVGATAA